MVNGPNVRSGPKPKPRKPCAGGLPGDYVHGERRTYKAGLCRGAACWEAASAYARQRYAARQELARG